MVGNVRSSYHGRVEDASDELEVRLALLDRAVGLSGCNATFAESAYPLGLSSCDSVSVRALSSPVILRPMNLLTQAQILALEALAVGCCKLVEE
eukprot:1610278-Pleurochrysis_carterae.AAC.1